MPNAGVATMLMNAAAPTKFVPSDHSTRADAARGKHGSTGYLNVENGAPGRTRTSTSFDTAF
jgi:hypothetical protein